MIDANITFVHLTIFYLWTVNVIFSKLGWSKSRKLRKGTPQKFEFWIQITFYTLMMIDAQCHIYVLTLFYLLTVNVIFPQWFI